jgi:hypothetical protein
MYDKHFFSQKYPRVGPWQRPSPPKPRLRGVRQPNFSGSDVAEPSVESVVTAVVTPAPPPPPPTPKVTEIEIGSVIGELTVVNEGNRDRNGNRYFIVVCRCSEGTKNRPLKKVREDHLRERRIVSCGCRKKQRMWERNKAGASNVGGNGSTLASGSEPEVVVAQPVAEGSEGSPQNASNPVLLVGGCPDGAIPGLCPHKMPISPYTPGRVYGVSASCWGCHNLWGFEELVAEWEKVLGLEHQKNFIQRLDVTVNKRLVLVGTSRSLDQVAESDQTALDWMEPDGDGTDGAGKPMRRRPARKTAPPGAAPDEDAVRDDD